MKQNLFTNSRLPRWLTTTLWCLWQPTQLALWLTTVLMLLWGFMWVIYGLNQFS